MKDHITDEKEDYKYIGLHGFDYKSFEEEGGVGNRYWLDGYTYLKHLILLWSCDWLKHMEKMNEAVVMNNSFTMDGGGGRIVRPFRRQCLWKCIGCVL